MSLLAIRGALQLRLHTMTPAIKFVYENDNYTPLEGTPYAEVSVVGDVSNPEWGDLYSNLERWIGHMLVLLRYPSDGGYKSANEYAELVQSRFPRRLSLSTGIAGVSVVIDKTPTIRAAFPDGTRYCVPVMVGWYCNIIQT